MTVPPVTIGIDKIRDHQMLKCGPRTEGDRFLLCPPRSTEEDCARTAVPAEVGAAGMRYVGCMDDLSVTLISWTSERRRSLTSATWPVSIIWRIEKRGSVSCSGLGGSMG